MVGKMGQILARVENKRKEGNKIKRRRKKKEEREDETTGMVVNVSGFTSVGIGMVRIRGYLGSTPRRFLSDNHD